MRTQNLKPDVTNLGSWEKLSCFPIEIHFSIYQHSEVVQDIKFRYIHKDLTARLPENRYKVVILRIFD